MKKIAFFLLLCFFDVNGQQSIYDVLPAENNKVEYKKVNVVKNSSKTELKTKAINWMKENDIKTIKGEDLDERHYFASGRYMFVSSFSYEQAQINKNIECRIWLTIINERYQYELSNFKVLENQKQIPLEIYQTDQKKWRKQNLVFYQNLNQEIEEFINSLTIQMKE